jgi:AcrR family transcriptional regulator
VSSASSPTESSATRAAILGAGRKLLLSRKAFSMGSVAKLAGVSRQAVYLHFTDRYTLLESIVDEVAAEASIGDTRQRIADAETGRDALAMFVATMVRVARSHGAIDQGVRATLASDPTLASRWARRRGRGAMVRAIVERLGADGALRPGVSAAECEAVIGAFTAPDVLVGLLGAVAEEQAVAMVGRAVEAALLGPAASRARAPAGR